MILITGGYGFLGSVLCKKIGNEATSFDNCMYGQKGIKRDITNSKLLEKYIKKCDIVVHLASIVGMPANKLAPELSKKVNIDATKDVIRLCKKYNKKLIFASSCSVYGNQPDDLITENSLINPLDGYAQQKYEMELEIQKELEDYTIVRFGTLFGMSFRPRFDLVANTFMAQSLTFETIKINGKGEEFRPFLHVEDAADSIIHVIRNDLRGIYNIVGENMTILRLAERISSQTGFPYEITNEKKDFRNYMVSGKKFYETGWKPQKRLDISDFCVFFLNGGDWKDPKHSNYDWLLQSVIIS